MLGDLCAVIPNGLGIIWRSASSPNPQAARSRTSPGESVTCFFVLKRFHVVCDCQVVCWPCIGPQDVERNIHSCIQGWGLKADPPQGPEPVKRRRKAKTSRQLLQQLLRSWRHCKPGSLCCPLPFIFLLFSLLHLASACCQAM